MIRVKEKKIQFNTPTIYQEESDLLQVKFEDPIDNSALYIAGSKLLGTESEVVFYSDTYTVGTDGVITFTLNTYNYNYLNYIKKVKDEIFLEIGQVGQDRRIYLFDKCFANPRVYIDGVVPTDIVPVYSKEEADATFTKKSQFNELSGIVSGDIQNLANNYWTKQETAAAIAQIQTMKIVVVQELPPIAEAEEYTIYLVPSTESSLESVYDEYLVINGAYEKIGTTAVDLTNYAVLSGGNSFVGDQIISGDIKTTYNSSGRYVQINQSSGNINIFRANNLGSAALFVGGGLESDDSYQIVCGRMNVKASGPLVVGGGTFWNERKNLGVLDWDGNFTLAGKAIATDFEIPSGATLSGSLQKIEDLNSTSGTLLDIQNGGTNLINYTFSSGAGILTLGALGVNKLFYFKNFGKYYSITASDAIGFSAPNINFVKYGSHLIFRIDNQEIYNAINGSYFNFPSGLVTAYSANNINDIPSSNVSYDLSLGSFTQEISGNVTYNLPTVFSGKENEITLEVKFTNSTDSITFTSNGSVPIDLDEPVVAEANMVKLFLIRYSKLKGKWYIFTLEEE